MDSSRTKKRILVVDDDDDVRDALCNVLVLVGHEAIGAVDGRAALNLLGRDHFDLIFTDLRMPGMDGWQLLAALQEDARLRRIPVCVVSAESTAPASATRIIRKPFELVTIFDLVDKILGREPSRQWAA
jgi:CheY-like chemotaxis protein